MRSASRQTWVFRLVNQQIMIKKNFVLERLRNNEPALGGWVMTNSVVAAIIMAHAGFQWVCAF